MTKRENEPSMRELLREQIETERKLAATQMELKLMRKLSQFPDQWRAGVIEYRDKSPMAYSYRGEFLEDGDGTFAASGTTTAIASVTNAAYDPVYLKGIFFAQYRVAGVPPLGVYLPPSGFLHDGAGLLIQGLNFTWSMSSSRGSRNWQDDVRDSLMLGQAGYYKLPAEQELGREELITIQATPLVAAVPGDSYRMFMVLDCYKMI